MATQRYQSLEVGDENEKVEAATHHNYGLKISSMQALLIGMVFFILLCFAAYASIALVDNQSGCLGAPYLYISHHDNHNVQKYTRDGCPVSPNVLRLGRTLDPAPSSIRSLIIHSYKGVKNALFVANAGSGTDFGRILVFDNCAGLNGMRPFLKTLVDQRTVSGAQHTCSISFDRKGDMYASFQNTDAVLRFSNSTYQPKSSPYQLPWFDDIYSKDDSYNTVVPISNSRNYTSNSDYFPGTFVQVQYCLRCINLIILPGRQRDCHQCRQLMNKSFARLIAFFISYFISSVLISILAYLSTVWLSRFT